MTRRDRRFLLVAAAALGVALVLAVLYPWIAFGYGVKDTLGYYRCRGGTTEYSSDYSRDGLAQIQVGMTEEEVVAILGEPIRSDPGGGEWIGVYASPRPAAGVRGGHFRAVRVKYVNAVARVTRVESRFEVVGAAPAAP